MAEFYRKLKKDPNWIELKPVDRYQMNVEGYVECDKCGYELDYHQGISVWKRVKTGELLCTPCKREFIKKAIM